VEGVAGEIAYRGDGGAECAAYLSFEGVKLGVGEEADLEDKVFADKKSTITLILRDCVIGEVERAVMRDAVVHLSSCHCLVKVREVLSSTPKARCVSEGPMKGMEAGMEVMVMN
jgi:hypothetical protein